MLVDHCFGSTTYRGGLFAGYNGDNAVVGRSFLKFSLPTGGIPTGTYFRVGNVNAYCTGVIGGGNNPITVSLGAQSLTNTTWVGSTMVWSTAPTVTPASATSTASVTYTPATPNPQWVAWNLSTDIYNTLLNANPILSTALTSTNESAAGWAYFAKREYDPTLMPTVTYGVASASPVSLTLSPTTVSAGGQVTATVWINGIGLGDQVTIYDHDPTRPWDPPALYAGLTGNPNVTPASPQNVITGLFRTVNLTIHFTPNAGITLPAPLNVTLYFYTTVEGQSPVLSWVTAPLTVTN